ncbi:MAG: AarF/UbiB family protein [Alphaproteobacteria bacterium]
MPAEYAAELQQLQTNAPAMGWAFVKRRMRRARDNWEARLPSSGVARRPPHPRPGAQSEAHDGRLVACKLQYPDMASAVEADLKQLKLVFAVHKRIDSAIDTSAIHVEIGARLREELDYGLEARHMALYREMLAKEPCVRVPAVVPEFSTGRLLTMEWLDGRGLLTFKGAPQEVRNHLATCLFRAWWRPFASYAAIHGDPHLGNYTVYGDGLDAGINLLDFGCIRTFGPKFVGGVVDLYRAMLTGDEALAVHAYETWGFHGLSREIIEALNIWARFIYAPMLEDRVRTVADGVSPAEYGRKEAFEVHKRLRALGPVKPPREFVFMDRAAIGLGAVFLHLAAELNFHHLFNAAVESFSIETVAIRQAEAFARAGVPLPNPAGDAA